MNKGNALLHFLYDHPWTSKPVLETIFGDRFSRLALAKETRRITVPGVMTCWAVRREKLSSVPGVRRREQAKHYVLARYGKDALWRGGSPGLWGADLIALVGKDQKFWLQVWVDHGGAAVEALPFITRESSSGKYASTADLVITGPLERAELIKNQLASKGRPGQSALQIYVRNEQTHLRISDSPRLLKTSSGVPTTTNKLILGELRTQRAERLENIRHDQNIGKLFLSLERLDFDLLAYVGDNPVFSMEDLAYFLAHEKTGCRTDHDRIRSAALERLEKLVSLGLIEQADAPLAGLKVSVLGLEVITCCWGISQESLRRFHQRPQKIKQGGNTTYSENALSHIQDHTRTVQAFLFGLFDAAWRLQKNYGGVDLHLDTIVGKRIYFEDLSTRKLDWVIPDAVVDLSFWRRTWRDGQVHDPKIPFAKHRLLIEVDRATNPITRLQDRIQKYGRIWKQLSGNPVQIWIIDGTPWREKEILEMMGTVGINGWTVLVERLTVAKDDPWWEDHFRPKGTLPYSKHGGMAPLRKIWRNTEDYKLHHLLDHTPWEGEMSLSGPIVKVPRGY